MRRQENRHKLARTTKPPVHQKVGEILLKRAWPPARVLRDAAGAQNPLPQLRWPSHVDACLQSVAGRGWGAG